MQKTNTNQQKHNNNTHITKQTTEPTHISIYTRYKKINKKKQKKNTT